MISKTQNFAVVSVLIVLFSLIFISAASLTGDAILVDSEYVTLFPGKEGSITMEVDNNEDYDIGDVSVSLNLEDLPFTSIGSNERNEDEIRDGDSEKFTFKIKAASSITPGDYNIPYTLIYTNDEGNRTTKTGSFGISVGAKTELSYSIKTKDNIVGSTGKVSVKIVNSGLGDIGFVSVKIVSSSGFEVLSSNEEYIGSIRSDDFELATFDVLYQKTTASITAFVTYKDFDNKEQSETVSLSVPVYSKEKALELGLIKKPNYTAYGFVAVLVVVWLVYRQIKKRRKKKE